MENGATTTCSNGATTRTSSNGESEATAAAATPVSFKLLSRKLVKPARPSPSPRYHLSSFDRWMHQWVSEISVPGMCFYAHDGSPDFMSTQVLEQSLAEVLAVLYPFAGRMERGEDEKLYVECNRDVIFQEALISSHALADFANEQPHDHAYELLNPWKTMVDESTATALSWIQVTRFSCGGVVLVASLSHTLSDVAGYSLFMRSWSSLARGVPMPRPILGKHPELKNPASSQRAAATRPAAAHIPPDEAQAGAGAGAQEQPDEAPKLSTFSKVFKFTAAQVEAMKQAAESPASAAAGARKVTRFEALACHTWRGVTRARSLPAEATTRLHIDVDCRSRIEPPLPAEKLGNLILLPSAARKAGEILERPRQETCRMIRDAVATVDDAAVQAFLEKIELGVAKAPAVDSCLDLEISSLWRVPLYSFDFGWGTPCSINLGWQAYTSPLAFFLPAPPNAAHCVEVALTGLTREHLTRLESDLEFMCLLN